MNKSSVDINDVYFRLDVWVDLLYFIFFKLQIIVWFEMQMVVSFKVEIRSRFFSLKILYFCEFLKTLFPTP